MMPGYSLQQSASSRSGDAQGAFVGGISSGDWIINQGGGSVGLTGTQMLLAFVAVAVVGFAVWRAKKS